MPSSPNFPCSTGNTTSTEPSALAPSPGSTTISELTLGSPDSMTAVPDSTSGSVAPVICSFSGSAAVSTQAPPRVMPTGTTSYRSGSSAASTLPADTTDTPCSLLRPP